MVQLTAKIKPSSNLFVFTAFPGAPQPPPTGYVPAPPHPAAAYAGKLELSIHFSQDLWLN